MINTESKPVRILIADDHQMLIDGIVAILGDLDQFQVVGHAHNGKEVLDFLKKDSVDVLVMDIKMPEMDGIEVLKTIEGRYDDMKIIVLSSYHDIRLIKEMLKAGAHGYLTKKSAAEGIIDAIESVINGGQYFDDDVQKKIVNAFPGANDKKERPTEGVLPISLTARELDILKLIAQEYSSKEIGEQLYISPNTVETHRKNLIRKLNVRNSIGLAKFALMHGII